MLVLKPGEEEGRKAAEKGYCWSEKFCGGEGAVVLGGISNYERIPGSIAYNELKNILAKKRCFQIVPSVIIYLISH